MSPTSHTSSALATVIKSIPNWCVWRMLPGEKKPRKVPFYVNGKPRGGTQGSPEDRAQLVTYEQALAVEGYSGLGFAVLADCGVIALDFDDVVVDGVVDTRVLDVIAGTYAEISPSGNGVRAFFKGSAASRKDLAREPKIELFGSNGFVTFTGNVLPEHDMLDWTEVIDITPACSAFLEARFGSVKQAGGFDLFSTLKPKLGLDVSRVREVLSKLPKDMSYDDWVKVGMAIHHECDDFEVFHDWSKTSAKYGSRKYCWERWRSFGRFTGGESLTFAWVVKQAGIVERREVQDAVNSYRQKIAGITGEFELRTEVADIIRADVGLQSFERALLANDMQARLSALGAKVPMAEVRKLVTARSVRETSLPAWAQGWVYVTKDDQFLRVGTEEWLSKQGFDAKFNRLMPRDENGSASRAASTACLEDWNMPVVVKALYVPWCGEFFDHESLACVNRFSAASMPQAAAVSGGVEKVVLEHLGHICNGRADIVRWLTQYLAHCVQHPGVKIRWSPVIKGIEGDGKSVLGEMLAGVMGPANVRSISPTAISSEFTAWAEGACVGVLEELKLTGHNRFDVMNKLKQYITNSAIEVIKKGRDPYNTHNTQNYIAFTNYPDALPVSNTDRRWAVIFTPWSNIDELAAVVGDINIYFDRLFETINSHPAELRRWLLDVDLTEFKPNGRAPLTEEKGEMATLALGDDEDLVQGVIETGGEGVTANVLSTACLSSLLKVAGLDLRSRSYSRVLLSLGWTKVKTRVSWKGVAHRCWVRRNMSKDASSIRAQLNMTDLI
jgi:hypothetical protein